MLASLRLLGGTANVLMGCLYGARRRRPDQRDAVTCVRPRHTGRRGPEVGIRFMFMFPSVPAGRPVHFRCWFRAARVYILPRLLSLLHFFWKFAAKVCTGATTMHNERHDQLSIACFVTFSAVLAGCADMWRGRAMHAETGDAWFWRSRFESVRNIFVGVS